MLSSPLFCIYFDSLSFSDFTFSVDILWYSYDICAEEARVSFCHFEMIFRILPKFLLLISDLIELLLDHYFIMEPSETGINSTNNMMHKLHRLERILFI